MEQNKVNNENSVDYDQKMIRNENDELDLESAVARSLGLQKTPLSSKMPSSSHQSSHQETWFRSEFIAEISNQQSMEDDKAGHITTTLVYPKKFDDRLFPDHLLYCEGLPKPTFRGVLHFLCTLLLPFGAYHLIVYESNGLLTGQIAAAIYLSGQFFCCFVSAIYHLGKYSPSIEIILQKLDHCGIAICTTAVNFPVSMLLLPSPYGGWLASLSTVGCLWTCWNILHRRPGVWRLVATACFIFFFFPLLSYYMTVYEFSCVIGNSVFMSIGVYIFATRWPDPVPNVFGYHEVFHVFTVLGFICIYLCNWSVIRRTCNPYLLDRDIFEDIFIKWMAHQE